MSIDFRKHMHLLVGFFVVSAVIVLIMTVTLLLNVQGLFNPEYRLYAIFDNGIGLNKGTAVKFKGVKVGAVEEINLFQKNGSDTGVTKVVMTLAIDIEYQKFITDSSVAYVMRDKNMVSDRVINIESKAWSDQILQNGDTLSDTTSQDIETLLTVVSELIVRIDKMMTEFDYFIAQAKDTGTMVGALIGSKSLYNKVLKDMDHAGRAFVSVTRMMQEAQKIEKEVSKVLPELLSNTDSTLRSAARTAGDLERAADRVDKILNNTDRLVTKVEGLLSEGGQTLQDADGLVDAVSDFWFIRGKIKKQNKKKFPLLYNDLGI